MHTYELVAAGSLLHRIIPIRGRLFEVSIHVDLPTPIYIDSASVIYVIHDRAAVKKSLWILRRAAILQEAAEYGEIMAVKISGDDNFSDPETKQLHVKAWQRHLWYANNLPGPMPTLN